MRALTRTNRLLGLTIVLWVAMFGLSQPGASAEDAADTFDARFALGTAHACGVRVDGTASCRGTYDGFNAVTPPTGAFISVASGGHHGCGIRPDGHASCW